MCPMYNDYGSFLRDRDEGNLNCIDFLEEHGNEHSIYTNKKARANDSGNHKDTIPAKRQKLENSPSGPTSVLSTQRSTAHRELLMLTEFERKCANVALEKLKKNCGLQGKMQEAL